jgi:hypothetical protein
MELEFKPCEDYEPSDDPRDRHPMHTDPLCKNCGGYKKDHK